MTLSQVTASFFPRSAISRAEWLYQQRSSGRSRRWTRWLGRAILIFAITMSMILFWGEVVGALLNRDAGPIGERLQIATIGFVGLAIIYHFVLMFRTLSLAANSISRERQNNTWDMLILTGIDARQIVRGKWAATVQRQWRSYLLLGIIRAGAIVWWGAASSRSLLTMYSFYSYSYVREVIYPSPLSFLFAGLAIIALTMVNLGFTAACGILASAQIRRSALALGRAIALRLLIILSIIVIVFGIPSIVGTLTHWQINLWQTMPGWLNDLIGRVLLTLVDNGCTAGVEFSSTQITYDYGFDNGASGLGYVALAIFITGGVYILLTRFLLGVAQWQAVRNQALPPPSDKVQIAKTVLF
jgi:hypothetical protein